MQAAERKYLPKDVDDNAGGDNGSHCLAVRVTGWWAFEFDADWWRDSSSVWLSGASIGAMFPISWRALPGKFSPSVMETGWGFTSSENELENVTDLFGHRYATKRLSHIPAFYPQLLDKGRYDMQFVQSTAWHLNDNLKDSVKSSNSLEKHGEDCGFHGQ